MARKIAKAKNSFRKKDAIKVNRPTRKPKGTSKKDLLKKEFFNSLKTEDKRAFESDPTLKQTVSKIVKSELKSDKDLQRLKNEYKKNGTIRNFTNEKITREGAKNKAFKSLKPIEYKTKDFEFLKQRYENEFKENRLIERDSVLNNPKYDLTVRYNPPGYNRLKRITKMDKKDIQQINFDKTLRLQKSKQEFNGYGNINKESARKMNAALKTGNRKIIEKTKKEIEKQYREKTYDKVALANVYEFGEFMKYINNGGMKKHRDLYEQLTRDIGTNIAYNAGFIGIDASGKIQFHVNPLKAFGQTEFDKLCHDNAKGAFIAMQRILIDGWSYERAMQSTLSMVNFADATSNQNLFVNET